MAENSNAAPADPNISTEQQHVTEYQDGVAPGPTSGKLQVLCGPLLNYHRMEYEGDGAFWFGSVLIVTKSGQKEPRLHFKSVGPSAGTKKQGWFARDKPQMVDGLKLYSDPTKTFWRFSISVPVGPEETKWEYSIDDLDFLSKVSTSPSRVFVVPAANDSMRIMFHSCNGFSVGTDEEAWSGPALWNDVNRVHEKRPFHVMVGGGDQIYNDGVRVDGPLKEWTAIGNPNKRRKYPFSEKLRADCDKFYFENYVRWYSTEPFATANASIPQINIWDDHDIIDGFGSYTDHFMRCDVFRGIGGVSFKYYCLFQHHVAPPKSTYTTDAPATMHAVNGVSTGADPQQLKDTYVYGQTADDPSWIVGTRPGPYVEERSRSLYMRLGKRMSLLGIDARTERTRHQVNYPDTYDKIFNRLDSEIQAAKSEIKHLILLLGIPIAYPRLAWLENLLSSPLIGPIRLLNRRFGFAGGLFNHFDGSVDLLDDLDDHYTSRHHKEERGVLMHRLQKFSEKYSIRITILGGDVHLAALGRFYSNPKLQISAENDHRYMANIVSSAITNKPPPSAIANLLAKRNKIHHLDPQTDETLMKIFDKQPGGKDKAAESNHVTMPSRNFATITEVTESQPMVNDNTSIPGDPSSAGSNVHHNANGHGLFQHAKDGHEPLHSGEVGAGVSHPAADGISSVSGMMGSLDVSIMVEIDQHDHEGRTQGYGFSIPPLQMKSSASSAPAPAGAGPTA